MSDASTRSYILLSVTMETTWGCAKLQLVNRSLRAQAYLSTSTKMTGAYRNIGRTWWIADETDQGRMTLVCNVMPGMMEPSGECTCVS